MSALARLYIGVVLALGTFILLWALPLLPLGWNEWPALLALTFCAATTQTFRVRAPKNQAYELTPIFVFAAVLLLSPGPLALLIVLAYLPEWIKSRRRWYIQFFNISICLLQSFLSKELYLWVRLGEMHSLGSIATPLGSLLAAAAFTALNHLLLAMVLRLARGHSWRDTRLFEIEYFLTDAALACMGYIVARLWLETPLVIAFVAAPLFLIQRALRTANLEEEARTDGKTGLYNARYFHKALAEELHRAARFDRPMAVIMCDLDLLRNINNNYGHMAGDAVLKGVAGILKRNLREYDIAARFGGEEFALMLPEADISVGVAVAERIRQQIEAARVQISTSVEPIRATISLGVAAFPTDGATPEEVLHQADLAVYLAKLRGRNLALAASPESRALGTSMSGREVPDTGLESTLSDPSLQSQNVSAPNHPTGDVLEPPRNGRCPVLEQLNSTPLVYQEPTPRSTGSHESQPIDPRVLDLPRQAVPNARLLEPLIALLIGALGLATAGFWLAYRPWEFSTDLVGLAVLVSLAVGAQSLSLDVYGHGRVSTSAVVIMAGGFIFGPPAALVLAPAVPLQGWWRNRANPHKKLFDLGDTTAAAVISTLVFQGLRACFPGANVLLLLVPAELAAVAYYGVNVGLLSVVIGLSEARSPLAVWTEKFRWLWVHYLVFGLIALFTAGAYDAMGVSGIIVFFVPLVMLRYAMKQFIDHTERNVREVKRINQELGVAHAEVTAAFKELGSTYDATVAALSAALDSRDSETEGHSQRVVAYASAIGREMGLSPSEAVNLMKGALLHDVGKIGVPDAILNKPGRLTPEEWVEMKKHSEMGYQMLRHIRFLEEALPVVRYHHERYDGGGYPHGLKGDAIPLIARVFSVADSFDAMTSRRPYSKPRDVGEALAEVARCAGAQFDPKVVTALLRVDIRELERLSGQSGDSVDNERSGERPPVPTPVLPQQPRFNVGV